MTDKFSFGKNWQRYIKLHVNEDVVNEAKKSLLAYTSAEYYKDKVFIDIGCGSGIFSLAALLLGCREVYSFDVDKNSVEAARLIRDKFAYLIKDKKWEIFEDSVLDDSFCKKFYEKGDIVYSWGVLHHTGSMWKAIENATKVVKRNGLFIIAIYNKAPSSEFWLKIKKYYNGAGRIGRFIMIAILFIEIIVRRIMSMKNPFKSGRGMMILTDTIDWLGGYPYEFASFNEIRDFVEERGFNFLKSPRGIIPSPKSKKFLDKISGRYTGCNEFVFDKK